MKIRSITCFIDPGTPLDEAALASAAGTARLAAEQYQKTGYEVQTTRLATTPFPQLYAGLRPAKVIEAVQELEHAAVRQGFDYVAIGPALLENPESYALIPEVIAATEGIFCSAQMASREEGLSLEAVKACAQIITQLAPQDENGFANLFFTALSNVDPGSPFFPAAYHAGDAPAFALALEAASLAVEAFEGAEDLHSGLKQLQESIEHHGRKLTEVGEKVQAKKGLAFNGLDFSLAPFPAPETSLGAALELIGVPKVGQHGSLAAAAMLASTLDQTEFTRVGFSGLLFPQLEDSVLALRASEGTLTVKDLLMYSAVCGTGLDTIPLPGDTASEDIAALLLDLAALGLRLDKPLTARLMPIPGKKAGEATNFDFDYFANSKVMSLEAGGLSAFLSRGENVGIKPRRWSES